MNELTFDGVLVGDALPQLELPPVSRQMLTLFADSSGDHHPIHLDPDYARAAGMSDVFAHGMLGMAWLGRLLTNWVPQSQLRKFEVRFTEITYLGDIIRCSGRVVEKLEEDGQRWVRVEVQSANQDGRTKIVGEVLVVLP